MARFNSVSFDIAELSGGAARYRQYSEELDSIKNELDDTMTELVRTYWVGTASVRFKKLIGDEWLDTTRRYCDLLYDLTLIMDDVVKTYADLLEQAKRLQIG